MLDPKMLRTDPEKIAERLQHRGFTFDVPVFHELETQRRDLQDKTQTLQTQEKTHERF